MDMARMLELLSLQRHDFLNHLQVISGLLQLNKEDRAREYIREVTRDIVRLSRVVHLKVPEVAAAFLIAHHRFADHDIEVHYDVQADLAGCAVPGKELGPVLEDVLQNIVEYLAPVENTERDLFIKINRSGRDYECIFSFNTMSGGRCYNGRETIQRVEERLAPYWGKLDGNVGDRKCHIVMFLPAGE
ncbi:Sensor_kinase_SpoOB-type, alpha-helical domain [Desulfoscipio geothermicus DSM 3669]|uniref:Sensor_kinase_SpoOB-type, alpha-helical domain n=2 Tax=Desulfoscipio geothermicus TaxID=39060 RepID=A0A1I6DS29_9FIRM|nr:Sensor_kinase_SpoOB-type, alpha-helical domain [Desulfoscipio geothermicus DSM 3669]